MSRWNFLFAAYWGGCCSVTFTRVIVLFCFFGFFQIQKNDGKVIFLSPPDGGEVFFILMALVILWKSNGASFRHSCRQKQHISQFNAKYGDFSKTPIKTLTRNSNHEHDQITTNVVAYQMFRFTALKLQAGCSPFTSKGLDREYVF